LYVGLSERLPVFLDVGVSISLLDKSNVGVRRSSEGGVSSGSISNAKSYTRFREGSFKCWVVGDDGCDGEKGTGWQSAGGHET